MKKKISQPILLVFVIASILFVQSCQKTGCTDPLAIDYDPDVTESGDCTYPVLSLHIHPVVGDQDFVPGNTYTINGVATKIDIAQFYLSNIRVGADGAFDENPETFVMFAPDQMTYEIGQITAGHKDFLQFNVGLDSATNHADPTVYEATHPLALQSPSMHWSWDAGYRFFNIGGEVDSDGDGTVDALLEYHIGKDSNLREVMLEAHKDVIEKDTEITIQLDLTKLFEGIDLASESISHTGDHPDVANKLVANVPGIFSIN